MDGLGRPRSTLAFTERRSVCTVKTLVSSGRLSFCRVMPAARCQSRRGDVQEARLSQRDRATLRDSEYFVKSLSVIPNDTLEQGVCKSLYIVLR